MERQTIHWHRTVINSQHRNPTTDIERGTTPYLNVDFAKPIIWLQPTYTWEYMQFRVRTVDRLQVMEPPTCSYNIVHHDEGHFPIVTAMQALPCSHIHRSYRLVWIIEVKGIERYLTAIGCRRHRPFCWRDVQPIGCDVTMLNYVSSLIAAMGRWWCQHFH